MNTKNQQIVHIKEENQKILKRRRRTKKNVKK